MSIYGDLLEQTGENLDSISSDIISEFENVPWSIVSGAKIPIEVFSLYSIKSEKISVQDVDYELFSRIKNSKFSHIHAHIDKYEDMFVLFFEFAIEKDINDYEFVHFGLVPTSDFFVALKSKPLIKIKDVEFLFSEDVMKMVLEKLNEFDSDK